jgi:hypothetical protein
MRQVVNARRPGRVHYNNHVETVATKGPVLLLLNGEVPDSNLGPFEWVLYSLPQSVHEDTGISLKLERGRFLTHTFQFTTVTVSESTFLNAESFCTMAHGTDTTWNSAIACLCDSVYKGRHVYMAFACIPHIADDASFNLSEPCVLYIGRAYRYPPNVRFYIFFFNNYKYWVF